MKDIDYHLRLALACSINAKFFLPKTIKPFLANIKLTQNCNSRCNTCNYWKEKSIDLIDKQRAILLLEELYNIGVRSIRFSGGEPLLRNDLFEIIESCGLSNKFDRLVLATNGLLLSKYHKEINKSSITNVTVSLDGVGTNNDRIRGVKGYYDKVIEGMSKLKNREIKIVSTLTDSLSDDIEELILFCKKHNYQYGINLPDGKLYFFASKNINEFLENHWPSEESLSIIIEMLRKYKIANKFSLELIRNYIIHKKLNIRHCAQGFFEIYFDSNGDVRPGCNVFKPVGNILNEPLTDIIKSNHYVNMALKMYNLSCPTCTCGYSISLLYQNPLRHIRQALRQL